MLSKSSGQIDVFSHMIFDKLIPKDPLLVKIDSIINFSFIYQKVKDKYSHVDPDARVAHKSPGNIKRGYKDHIIVDEDSEIILASVQTPFNTRVHDLVQSADVLHHL